MKIHLLDKLNDLRYHVLIPVVSQRLVKYHEVMLKTGLNMG